MKKILIPLLLLAAGLFISAAVHHHRWSIKTKPHTLEHPRNISLADLIDMTDPPDVSMNDKRYEETLIPHFENKNKLNEGDLVTTNGYIHLVAYEDNDQEFHIQISESPTNGDNCFIVEVPDPANVDDAKLKQKYEAVRNFIKEKILFGKEPNKSGNVISGQPFVSVTGQLFFDDAHTHNQIRGKKGMHSNSLWEIHPIVDMAFAHKPN